MSTETINQVVKPTLPVNIILAEDDYDDCYLFKYSLEELKINFRLTTLKNGEELMSLLNSDSVELPHVVFLDINMPRKNGLECLAEIKGNEKLKHLAVIILSTSYSPSIIKQLFNGGAHFYIQKPCDVVQFRQVIGDALTLVMDPAVIRPVFENFMLVRET